VADALGKPSRRAARVPIRVRVKIGMTKPVLPAARYFNSQKPLLHAGREAGQSTAVVHFGHEDEPLVSES
jgi:hypothetical protein